MLPYMEQPALYDGLNPRERTLQTVCRGNDITGTTDTLTDQDKSYVQATISTFRCPSDDGDKLNMDTCHFGYTNKTVYLTMEENPVAKSNYAACMGESRVDSASVWSASDDNNGVFYANSSMPMSGLVDGTSNVVFFGEVCTSKAEIKFFAATWLGVGNPGCTGDGSQGVGTPEPENDTGIYRTVRRMKSDILINSNRPDNYNKCYSSHHPGGAHFGFGDGSVHFLSETINTDVYDLLGRRASRQTKSFK